MVTLDLFDDSAVEIWNLFFIGAGLILLLEAGLRLAMPAYRQPIRGNVVLAIIFLAIGLGGLLNWALIWALAVIAIGAYLLLSGLFRYRE